MIAMSVQNISMVLHGLRHQVESGVVSELNRQLIAATEAVSDLVLVLHQSFQQKSNRGYAAFSEPAADDANFVHLLAGYLDGQSDFINFSCSATDILTTAINKYSLVCEGYLYYIHYQYVGADYLMVGIFENEESVSFTDGFDIQKVKYIDLNQMGLVARIDLSQYRIAAENKRYISFIKGRAGRKVSDFFMEFLSAEEGIDQKLQNETLIKAIASYADSNRVPVEQLYEAKKELQSYCKEQLKAGADLESKRMGEIIPETGGQDFYSFLTQEVGLPESFPPSPSALRTMTKFVGSGGGLTISFDQKLLGQRISYDAATDTLTIVGMPPNLKDQLLRHQQ